MSLPGNIGRSVFLCVACCLVTAMASAGQLNGWVRDTLTGAPIEGAVVSLDLEPANGTPEYQRTTPISGFFTIRGMTNGSYRLRIERPGYALFEEPVAIGDAPVRRTFDLNVLPGGPGFDLLIQVADVTTGLQISNIFVVAERRTNPGDAVPAATFTGRTDTNGFLAFRGMSNGHYRFQANAGVTRAGWEPFTPATTTNLTRSHMANILLKPVPQNLTVQVNGLDPVGQLVGPLTNHIVEVTGLDPLNTNLVVVPARSAPTDATGQITFPGLPSAAFLVRTKHLGYDSAATIVFPNASGLLTMTSITLTPAFQTNDLRITFTSAYNPAQFLLFYNLPVTVQGLKGTGTEGVNRLLNQRGPFDPPHQRFTTNLPPGRYRISVNGAATTNNFYPVRPHFTAEDYVEVMPGQRTDVTFRLETVPALIRGKLFAADEMSDLSLVRRPIYRPRQQTNIEIIAYATDGMLPTNASTFVVHTDAAGEFVVSLPPARYGVRIAGMTNYWGSHVALSEVRTNTVRQQGWPFATNWPFGGLPPFNDTPNPGTPLTFLPRGEYALELFVRRQEVYLSGLVPSGLQIVQSLFIDWLYSPADHIALAINLTNPVYSVGHYYQELLMGGPTATLTRVGGGSRTVPVVSPGVGYTMAFSFDHVTPGVYTLDVSVPRHSVSNSIFGGHGPGLPYAPLPVTLNLPPWAPPGVLPATDPLAAEFIKPMTDWYPTDLWAHYPLADTTVTMEYYAWNPGSMEYFPFGSNTATNFLDMEMPIDFVEPAYSGGKVFFGSRTLPGLRWPVVPMVHGAWKFWSYFGDGWFSANVPGPGDYTFQVYFGGPQNNLNAAPPNPSYELRLRAVSDDDPEFMVPGTTNTFDGAAVEMNNQVLSDYRGPLIGTVQNPNWQYLRSEIVVESPAKPRLVHEARMKRGTAFRGTVANAATSTPVTNAQVTVRDRFGRAFMTLSNGTNGSFSSPTALAEALTVFVEVNALGYKPWRQRFTPADAVQTTNDPPLAALVLNVALEPIPPPEIVTATLDRYGLFLPGVSKAGNQDVFSGFSAESALTMTWALSVLPQTVTNSLPRFDLPSGALGGLEDSVTEDSIAEIWFIDPRAFASHRYNDAAASALPPLSDDPAEFAAWLRAIADGGFANVFHQRVNRFTVGPTNLVTATNTVPLWKMPPGELKPIWAVVTRGGVVALKENYQFPAPPDLFRLRGVPLPPWLASAADIIGVAAGVKATADELEDVVPLGRFVPLPDFTASITNSPLGLVNYDYTLNVDWSESEDTPDSGFLALAPGALGLNFSGRLHFGVSGEEGQVFLRAATDVHTGEINLKRFLPKWTPKGAEAKGRFNVTNFASVAKSLGGAREYDFVMTNLVTGGFALEAEANLAPITSKIPYVGPVLAALDKTETLQAFATLRGAVGLRTTNVWATLAPGAFLTTDPDPQPMRRHFLGGAESNRLSTFDLCFYFEPGLRLSALGDALGAEGSIALEGPECNNQDSAIFSLNTSGDWPLIKRITGQVTAKLHAYLKIWIAEVGVDYEWSFITFDHEFGTEPLLQFIPLNRVDYLVQPAHWPQVQFVTNGPTLVNNFFRAGSISGAAGSAGAGGGCALLFTDTEAGTGRTLLKATFAGPGDTWSAPVTITAAGGIVDSALVRLASGQWMAAWIEIDATNALNPYASSFVKSSISDVNGQNWSAPATAAALPDMAKELKLVAGPALVGLAFTHTADGPLSDSYSLDATSWNGSQWRALVTLVTNEAIADFAAAADMSVATPAGMIACTDAAGLLRAFTWQGAVISGAPPASSDSGRRLALAATVPGRFHLTHETSTGDLALQRFDVGAGWTNLGTVVSGVHPAEVQLTTLTDAGEFCFLLTWVAGADVTRIYYAYISTDGDLLRGPLALTANTSGRYRNLSVLPAGGKMAKVIAHYTGTNDSVQAFTVNIVDAPQFGNAGFAMDGGFEFDVLGATERTYRVQSSSNLFHWVDLLSFLATNNPTRIHIPPTNAPHRFFRAVTP